MFLFSHIFMALVVKSAAYKIQNWLKLIYFLCEVYSTFSKCGIFFEKEIEFLERKKIDKILVFQTRILQHVSVLPLFMFFFSHQSRRNHGKAYSRATSNRRHLYFYPVHSALLHKDAPSTICSTKQRERNYTKSTVSEVAMSIRGTFEPRFSPTADLPLFTYQIRFTSSKPQACHKPPNKRKQTSCITLTNETLKKDQIKIQLTWGHAYANHVNG